MVVKNYNRFQPKQADKDLPSINKAILRLSKRLKNEPCKDMQIQLMFDLQGLNKAYFDIVGDTEKGR